MLVSLTRLTRNVGFPAGCNMLLRECTSAFVLIFNPDVELRPGVLSRLKSALVANPRIALATCQLRTRDGRSQSEPARARPTLLRLVAANAPAFLRSIVRRNPAHAASRKIDAVIDVDATMGALLLLPRRILQDVGLFDESVFMYLEGLDFSAQQRALAIW